jgi:hypothetical protein
VGYLYSYLCEKILIKSQTLHPLLPVIVDRGVGLQPRGKKTLSPAGNIIHVFFFKPLQQLGHHSSVNTKS